MKNLNVVAYLDNCLLNSCVQMSNIINSTVRVSKDAQKDIASIVGASSGMVNIVATGIFGVLNYFTIPIVLYHLYRQYINRKALSDQELQQELDFIDKCVKRHEELDNQVRNHNNENNELIEEIHRTKVEQVIAHAMMFGYKAVHIGAFTGGGYKTIEGVIAINYGISNQITHTSLTGCAYAGIGISILSGLYAQYLSRSDRYNPFKRKYKKRRSSKTKKLIPVPVKNK